MKHTNPSDIMDTSQAAKLLNVPADLISKWRHRQLVTPIGLIPGRGGRGKGRALYDLAELRPLADRYHRRRNTTRQVGIRGIGGIQDSDSGR